MNSAAIIGADSMLGRQITRQLTEREIDVIRIGRASHNDIQVDLVEPLRPGVCGEHTADVTFHCASAFAGDDTHGARTNFSVNATGCMTVLSLLETLGCDSCIYAGTLSSIEGFDSRQMSTYGLSKAQGEQILDWGAKRNTATFCSLRLAQLYDTDGLCCTHQPWFGRIIAYASRGLDLRLPPSEGPRNFLHVADAARLMIRAAERKLQGIWPLCHHETIDNSGIAEIAFRRFDRGGNVIIDHTKKPFRSLNFPEDRGLFERLADEPGIQMAEGIARICNSGHSDRFGPMDVT